MPRTPEQNREYMRKYRAREKSTDPCPYADCRGTRAHPGPHLIEAASIDKRFAALTEEVRRLKEELAQRSLVEVSMPGATFNTRPFTPVPKGGK